MRRSFPWLVLIVLLGAFLRLFKLGENPPGLYWDEVSLGWNAFSVLKTGMDEHGRRFPLDTFYAFGDYKPPGYIYAALPAVWLFGLNEFAIRLPSALAGIGLILLTYFLAKGLIQPGPARLLPTLAALLVAISPWSVTLSRVAFESNLAVLFHGLGALLFYYAVSRSPRWLPLSVISFVLSAYTFNANRLLAPLFLLFFTLVYIRQALKNWKWWVSSAVIGIFLVLPMIGHIRSPEGKLRWREVNIFSNLGVIEESNARRAIDNDSILSRLLHHRFIGYTRLFLQHYLSHFQLNYLFLDGDPNPRISIPDMGQLYLFELPFFLVGLTMLLAGRGQISIRERVILGGWLLLAAVPAGMAREVPHALRSASTLPVPQIMTAIGMISLLTIIDRKFLWRTKLFLAIVFLFLLLSLVHFQLLYYRYYPYEWAPEWLTSYKRLVGYLKPVSSQYDRIYVTSDLGRPYVYFLFYSDYDPKKFIEEAKAGGRVGDALGFFHVHSFGPYQFSVPDLPEVFPTDLVVTRADKPPDGFQLLTTISETNGYEQFNVIRKQ